MAVARSRTAPSTETAICSRASLPVSTSRISGSGMALTFSPSLGRGLSVGTRFLSLPWPLTRQRTAYSFAQRNQAAWRSEIAVNTGAAKRIFMLFLRRPGPTTPYP
jgi:hypothetical protein